MTVNIPNSGAKAGLAGQQSDAFVSPDLLIAGSFPVETSAGVLLDQNADLPAYTVLGRITANGKLKKSAPGNNDGSQVPVGVSISFHADPGADSQIRFYRSGNFNFDALANKADWTLAQLRIAVENSGAPLFFEQAKSFTPTEHEDAE